MKTNNKNKSHQEFTWKTPMWVKTTDGDKPGTIHYENQSTKIAITMRDSIWMLQSLNLHSISPIVFGNRNRELRIAFFALARRLCCVFRSTAKPRSRNPRNLGFTKVARSCHLARSDRANYLPAEIFVFLRPSANW